MMDLETLPLNQLLFNFNSRPDLMVERSEKEAVEEKEKPPLISSKYDDEVAALKERFGEFEGRSIEITLAEILDIIPKQRRRVDAYNGLVKWLSVNFNTTLTIKSNKHGKKEN